MVLECAGVRSRVRLKMCKDQQTIFYWLGERRRRNGGRPKAKSIGTGEPGSSAAFTCCFGSLSRTVSRSLALALSLPLAVSIGFTVQKAGAASIEAHTRGGEGKGEGLEVKSDQMMGGGGGEESGCPSEAGAAVAKFLSERNMDECAACGSRMPWSGEGAGRKGGSERAREGERESGGEGQREKGKR